MRWAESSVWVDRIGPNHPGPNRPSRCAESSATRSVADLFSHSGCAPASVPRGFHGASSSLVSRQLGHAAYTRRLTPLSIGPPWSITDPKCMKWTTFLAASPLCCICPADSLVVRYSVLATWIRTTPQVVHVEQLHLKCSQVPRSYFILVHESALRHLLHCFLIGVQDVFGSLVYLHNTSLGKLS